MTSASLKPAPAPVPMILHCPVCSVQHVDSPDARMGWTNPPHRSHLCHVCGTIWRPADVPTTGVARTQTQGSADTWRPESALAKPAARPLLERLREACLASCKCRTKTPDVEYHDQMCTYRLHFEAMMALEAVQRLVACPSPTLVDGEVAQDAERFKWGVTNACWIRHEHQAYVAIPVAMDSDLSCLAMRVRAIDIARAAKP